MIPSYHQPEKVYVVNNLFSNFQMQWHLLKLRAWNCKLSMRFSNNKEPKKGTYVFTLNMHMFLQNVINLIVRYLPLKIFTLMSQIESSSTTQYTLLYEKEQFESKIIQWRLLRGFQKGATSCIWLSMWDPPAPSPYKDIFMTVTQLIKSISDQRVCLTGFD